MKRIYIALLWLAMVTITACNAIGNPIKGNAIIDWVDFVKINHKTYNGLYDAVLADPGVVLRERVVGKVAFRVGDVVTNPEYRTKDGDAAFLEIGTELYEVEGYKDQSLIAAKDEHAIHGYRLYQVEGSSAWTMKFKDLVMERVERIEIYKDNGSNQLLHKVQDGPDIQKFIDILEAGSKTPTYEPKTAQSDPTYYEVVFYIENQVAAYKLWLAYDGNHYYFSSGDTHAVSSEIGQLIPKS
ncbi:hypothetical protein [Paenibacillus guangzhouensis]|uniref:hypothetical protein n=1 Tax=Paenibacillus guangzhouensis TaxID=1473112 RepID=UPI001266EB08|nr:hypothetical protein [Paenibacillus guangzhouensis]